MKSRKIVVLDTNFIVENSGTFIKILEKLAKVADVYIPRVVIQERFAQIHRDLKQKYDKLNNCKIELGSIAEIKELEQFDVSGRENRYTIWKALFKMAFLKTLFSASGSKHFLK